ncbi:MAG: AAA family ATPase [Rhodospirillales bacterium]|nr:MAG: AAA family ATPase [Rhodospirillales bacterium]
MPTMLLRNENSICPKPCPHRFTVQEQISILPEVVEPPISRCFIPASYERRNKWVRPEMPTRSRISPINQPSQAGDQLVKITRAEDLHCVMQRLKPAHTTLILAYEGAYRPDQSANAYLLRLKQLLNVQNMTPAITLDQLAGMNEATTWGMTLANDLYEYNAGRIPWSAVDRGCLLFGPPGTGKTTFARALAGSCGLPLISASLAQWQSSGHLGDLLKSMRATFDAARAAAPSILFVDEVDGFGNRSQFKSEYRDYSAQVVNGFLELLDGITGREGVVVVAACNHPERLDPAIVRSGRLDRSILIPLPDQEAIAKILRYHLGQDLNGIDLKDLAKLANGGTGADVERWVRGARRCARNANRPMVLEDLSAEIRGKVRRVPAESLRRSAIHEAGHAVMTAVYRPNMLVMASIRQTEESGGGVTIDVGRGAMETRADINFMLVHLLAGRAAEQTLIGDVSAGSGGSANSDLARATALATLSLTALGMDDQMPLLWIGMPNVDSVGPMLNARPDLARKVSALLEQAYEKALNMIQCQSTTVLNVADMLQRRETLDASEIIAIVGGQCTVPHVSDYGPVMSMTIHMS